MRPAHADAPRLLHMQSARHQYRVRVAVASRLKLIQFVDERHVHRFQRHFEFVLLLRDVARQVAVVALRDDAVEQPPQFRHKLRADGQPRRLRMSAEALEQLPVPFRLIQRLARRQHLMNIHAGNRPARADGKVAVLT